MGQRPAGNTGQPSHRVSSVRHITNAPEDVSCRRPRALRRTSVETFTRVYRKHAATAIQLVVFPPFPNRQSPGVRCVSSGQKNYSAPFPHPISGYLDKSYRSIFFSRYDFSFRFLSGLTSDTLARTYVRREHFFSGRRCRAVRSGRRRRTVPTANG